MINLTLAGGLGNRIKPLASALMFDEDVRVYWCNTYPHMYEGRTWEEPFIGGLDYYFRNVFPTCECNHTDSNVVTTNVGTWRFLRQHSWWDNWDFLYDLTPPFRKEQLFAAFAQLTPTVAPMPLPEGQPWIGLQIRKHHTTFKVDLNRWYDIVAQYPDHRILLVTDCHMVESEVSARYGNRLVYMPKSFRHSDTMRDRSNLIEILTLAQCQVGALSAGSTFGECAYWFSGGRMVPHIVSVT